MNNEKLNFDDVLVMPAVESYVKSRKDVNLIDPRFDAVPIVAANMASTGTFETAQILASYKIMTCLHKHYELHEYLDFLKNDSVTAKYVWYSFGACERDINKLKLFINGCENRCVIAGYCLDVANGHSLETSEVNDIYEFLKTNVKEDVNFMVGNFANPEIDNMDYDQEIILKMGIGPGAMCETRNVTGVGYPQLSLIEDTVYGPNEINHFLCSDGGIKTPGDFTKAFVAGADLVMAGTIFAEHHEQADSKGLCQHYGMSSKAAHQKHYNDNKTYKAFEGSSRCTRPEKSLHDTCQQILGGLRSAGTYLNCDDITNFYLCSNNMLRVSSQK